MGRALKAAPLCSIVSFESTNPFYSLCGSLDVNSLDVVYEELAKDKDVPNNVDEEIVCKLLIRSE